MSTRPPIPDPISVELRTLAERACSAVGLELQNALTALQEGADAEGMPEALRAGWAALDAHERAGSAS